MIKKAAMLLATGFEEGESLLTVDILRRAGITCDIVSVEKTPAVKGSHDIVVQADKMLDDSTYGYDMIVLPGGMPGAANLQDNASVIEAVRDFDKKGKWIAAICAAPIVLLQAGIIKGRSLTSYPGEKYEPLFHESDYRQEPVVVDKNLITSRGPATTFLFAYTIVDALGGDSEPLKKGMLYSMIAK